MMIFLFVCTAFILVCVCLSIYGLFFDREPVASHYNPYDDELTSAILQLIADCYSPINDVRLNQRLRADLGLDMVDVADLLFDASRIAESEVSARELLTHYGADPTVSQLIKYVRSTIHTKCS